mgnify:CR=1 FL=1
MIDRINNNQIPDILRDAGAGHPKSSRPGSDKKADASIQITYGTLIEQAKQEPPEDAAKVEKARQMLLSGRLDSPENIRRAAENIIHCGV